MSAMLSRAARRIEPPRPRRRRRWPLLTAGLAIVGSALAAAAAAMNRRGSGPFARTGKTQESAPAPGTEPESAEAASGADANGRVRTS